MTNFQDFQRSIRMPEYRAMDEADREGLYQQYANAPDDMVTVERAYELGLVAMQECVRVAEAVKALALECPPTPSAPQKRTRGRTQRLTVRANLERATVTVLGKHMSAEQARALGTLLLQAASEVEGNAYERTYGERLVWVCDGAQ